MDKVIVLKYDGPEIEGVYFINIINGEKKVIIIPYEDFITMLMNLL